MNFNTVQKFNDIQSAIYGEVSRNIKKHPHGNGLKCKSFIKSGQHIILLSYQSFNRRMIDFVIIKLKSLHFEDLQ